MSQHITYMKELDRLYSDAFQALNETQHLSLPIRRFEEQHQIAFPRHFENISHMLSARNTDKSTNEVSPLFETIDDCQTVRVFFTDDLIIQNVNKYADSLYGAQVGDHIEVLSFSPATLELITSTHKLIRNTSQMRIIKLCKLGSHSVILGTLQSRFDRRSGNWITELCTGDFIWPSQLDDILNSRFFLTNAEIQIIQLIFEGYSVEFIAEARDCVISTVRSQLRTIYDKVSCTNMVELIRLISGIIICPLINR